MFELVNKPNKDNDDGDDEMLEFELEEEMHNSGKKKTRLDSIRQRMLQIKDILRGGESEESFQKLGLLLHGYVAALKVIDRVKAK